MSEHELRKKLPDWIPPRAADLYWSDFETAIASRDAIAAHIAKLDLPESAELQAALSGCSESHRAKRRAWRSADRKRAQEELSDFARRECAREALFRDPRLEAFWRRCASQLPPREMIVLFVALIGFINFFPESGEATRQYPDRKIKILARQKAADKLRHDLATKAREMVRLLEQVADLPPFKWPDISLGALLNRRFERHPVDRDALIPRLYSHHIDRAREVHEPFPTLREVLSTFAERLEAFPDAKEVFRDNPAMRSSKSTWRDFVRVASHHLSVSDCRCTNGEPFTIREADWVSLVEVLLYPFVNREAVNACLRELRCFSADKTGK